jgi:hypothetical protein
MGKKKEKEEHHCKGHGQRWEHCRVAGQQYCCPATRSTSRSVAAVAAQDVDTADHFDDVHDWESIVLRLMQMDSTSYLGSAWQSCASSWSV